MVEWLAVCYLGAIILAEALTTLVNPLVGLVFHGLTLLALLLHSAFTSHIQLRRFLLALSLAPLTRLLSMMMPLQHFRTVNWYLLVGLPLFLAAFYIARVGQLNRKVIGITARKLPLQLLVSLTGFILGYLEFSILQPAALVPELTVQRIWLPAIILLIFTGLLEELIFRGLLQYSAISVLGQTGMVYMALVFTIMHMGYHSWPDLVFVFAVALFFGWVVQRSGSILGVTLAHGLTNICLFLIFPFLPVPMLTVTIPWLDHPKPALSQPALFEKTPSSTPGMIINTPTAAPSAPAHAIQTPAPSLPAAVLTATPRPTDTSSPNPWMTRIEASPTWEGTPTATQPLFRLPIPTRGPIRRQH